MLKNLIDNSNPNHESTEQNSQMNWLTFQFYSGNTSNLASTPAFSSSSSSPTGLFSSQSQMTPTNSYMPSSVNNLANSIGYQGLNLLQNNIFGFNPNEYNMNNQLVQDLTVDFQKELEKAQNIKNNTEYRASQISSQISEYAKIVVNSNLNLINLNQQILEVENLINETSNSIDQLQINLQSAQSLAQVNEIKMQINNITNKNNQEKALLNNLVNQANSHFISVEHYNKLAQNIPGSPGLEIDKNNIRQAYEQSVSTINRIRTISNKIQNSFNQLNDSGNNLINQSNSLCVVQRGEQFWKNSLNDISSNFSNKSTTDSITNI